MRRLERRGRTSAPLLLLAASSWAQPSIQAGSQLAKSPSAVNTDLAMAESAAMAESLALANGTGAATLAPVPMAPLAPTAPLAPAVPIVTAAPPVTPLPTANATLASDCKVLAGTFAKLMQVLLFAVCCAALVVKYRREGGGRTTGEFILDSSKQLLGAGWIHVLNLSFAKVLDAHFKGSHDECSWYWINIVLDCTLGVIVEYVLLLFLMSVIQKTSPGMADDLETGDYKGQDDKCHPGRYVKQLTLWLLIVSLMKIAMLFVMSVGSVFFLSIAEAVLSPFQNSQDAKLFVVMILTPTCMNVFQFWMTDNFIKKKGSSEASSIFGDTEQDGAMHTRIQHGDM